MLVVALLADIGVFVACSAILLGIPTSLSIAVSGVAVLAIGFLGIRLFPPNPGAHAELSEAQASEQAYSHAVEFRDFSFAYPNKPPVLTIPHLDLEGPRLTAIVGHSGAGKSTLVSLIAAQEQLPYKGSLKVFGQEWKDLATGRDAARQGHRRKIGYIPQSYGLLPDWTVKRTLSQDLEDADIPKGVHAARIDAALREMGIAEHREAVVRDLSGGQQQRVAIARMLSRQVSLIIADEPTANLDPQKKRDVVGSLRRASKNALTLIVTHDWWVANQCDDMVLLESQSIPGYFGHQPTMAVTSREPGHLELWVFGADAPLRHQYRGEKNLWSRWAGMEPPRRDSPIIRLTGGIASDPSSYEILAVDSDGKSWRRGWNGQAWQEWVGDDPGTHIENLTGIRSVSMSSGGPSQREWWATLNDGRIVHKGTTIGGTSPWQEMDTPDGRRIATLAAGSVPERAHVALLAIDIWGNTWHRRWDNQWMPWEVVAVPIARAAAITSARPLHLEMWIITIDGKILHRWLADDGPQWSDWRAMDTPDGRAVISICGSSQGKGSHDIIVETADRVHWHREYLDKAWGPWTQI